MTTKIEGKYSGEGNRINFKDVYNNHASDRPVAGVVFHDHFLGKAWDVTNKWTALDTAGATETLLADQPGGVVQLLLTNAAEIQLAGMYTADERQFTLNRGLNFEARIRFTTLPANATTAVIGLTGNTNAAIDTIAESIWFRWDFSGAVTVECDDTAAGHEKSKVATGVTLLADIWHVFRISCDDIASCRFFIDGAQVAASTTFNMNTVPTLQLQPMLRLDKAADALNLGVMEVDYVTVWQNLS